MLHYLRYHNHKRWNFVYACIIFLIAGGCGQGDVEPKHNSDQLSIQKRKATADTVFLKDLPPNLHPKSILLENKLKPLSITVPSSVNSDNSKTHPLFSYIDLVPPVEVDAGHSTVTEDYSTEQGLAVDVISCSFADSKGNLWFGTFVGGLSRYDGHTFAPYTTSQGLTSNEVWVITEDQDGNIWIGTSKGVSKFDGVGFTTIGNFGRVHDILQDKNGSLWFALEDGIVNYLDGETILYSEKNGFNSKTAHSLEQDKHGNVWIGTERGISIFDGSRFTNIDDVIDDLYKPVRQVLIDSSQVLWLSSNYGFATIEKGNATYFPFPFANRMQQKPSVFLDSGGNIWLSSAMQGVLKYDGSKFTSINKSHGLVSDNIMDIEEDNSGNIWFSTDAGVSKYSGNAIINFTREQGIIDGAIRSIIEDDQGNLWFAGNSHGLSRFDKNKFLNYNRSQGLQAVRYWAIEKDGIGNLWIGTGISGLIKFDGTSFTTYNEDQGLADKRVYFIYSDINGSLYLATEKGVSVFDGASFTNYSEEQGLVDDLVYSITKDREGRYWFGTAAGISCFDGKSFINYSGENGPGNEDIKTSLEDKYGNLWFGSYGQGLYRFDGNYFHQYTTKDGLPNNTITQLALTKEGHIVAGTNHGIAILEGFSSFSNSDRSTVKHEIEIEVQNDLINIELADHNPVFEVFNTSTGYPIKDVNRGQHGIYLDQEGILWIATGSKKSGLVRFDHDAIKKNKEVPVNVLTNILVNDRKISWYNLLKDEGNQISQIHSNYSVAPYHTEEVTTFGKSLSEDQRTVMKDDFKGLEFDAISSYYPIPQNLVVPYEHNKLTIEFTAIEPSRPKLIQYQYWLEGYGQDWSTPNNKTSATFGNIFEGDHTFHLRSQSPSGLWSEPLSYSFKVLPPWYRTIWAYGSYLLFFLFGLRLFSKYRERRLIAEKEKLELTVLERTDELILEKKKSDDLLLNILPEEIAQELKEKGRAEARDFEVVSILFSDFKGFTRASEKLSAQDLVSEINTCFEAFDNIMGKYGIEKVKTIGDSYMAAGGLPVPTDDSLKNTVMAALEMQVFIGKRKADMDAAGKPAFEMRVGIHTGPVVAGIVGVKKFQYDIWGDTVNTASRMESSGAVGKVNISQASYELLKDDAKFAFESRGKIEAKGKGEIEMYFVSKK